MEGKIKIGPIGEQNTRSTTMVNWDEGNHNGIISQIFIYHSSKGICSLQFQFVIDNEIVLSDRHGQNISDKFDVIALDYPHEYITGISGTYRTGLGFDSTQSITSLRLVTNSSEYGPFGTSDSFHNYDTTYHIKLGKFPQFGGFYGTYDDKGLTAIGVYLQPKNIKPKTEPETSTIDAESKPIVLG